MEIALLVQTIAGLVVVLGILIFILMLPQKINKKPKVEIKEEIVQKVDTDLENIKKIIKNRNSTAEELSIALDLMIKHHGKIPDKLGTRTNPGFDVYVEVIFTLCRHPKVKKDILVKFNKELVKLNPTYKKEIEQTVVKGLNART